MKIVIPVRIHGKRRIVYIAGIGYVVIPVCLTIRRSPYYAVRAGGRGIKEKNFSVNELTAKAWMDTIHEAMNYVAEQRPLSSILLNKEVDGFSIVDHDKVYGSCVGKSGQVYLRYGSAVVKHHCHTCKNMDEARNLRKELVEYTLSMGTMDARDDLIVSKNLSSLILGQV